MHMKNSTSIILVLTILISFGLDAQNQSPNPYGSSILIPQTHEDLLKGDKITKNVQFFEYEFRSTKIDVRDMKKKYPDLVVEDFVEIIPPDLYAFGQVSILMAVVNEHKGEKAKLLIWFAGNYRTNNATFFIDDDFDRNYLNDSAPIHVSAGAKPTGIKVYPDGENSRPVELSIKIPKKKRKELSRYTEPIQKIKSKNSNNIVVGVYAGFGSGDVHHDYISTVTNFPGWYDGTLSEKHLGISIDKYFQKFKFGVNASYQNIFQYASHFKLRTGEREVIISPSGIRTVKENLITNTNIDEHASSRFELGLSTGFRIHLGPLMELQPTVNAGYLFYSGGQYLANRFENSYLRYDQKSDKFIEIGLEFDMVVGYQRSISVGFFYNNVDWNPEGFFDTIEGEDLNRHYRSFSFLLGYRFGL